MLITLYLLQVLLLSPYSLPSSLPSGSAQSTVREIPTVGLCEILRKPENYDGKEIRVQATYHIGFEHSYFRDSSCKEYAVESTPYWMGNVIWATFDRPTIQTSTEHDVYEEFNREARPCCPSGWSDTKMEMTVVGSFSMAKDKAGYGHSERYALQIVVSKIEKVSATKGTDPSPKENRSSWLP